MPKQITPLENQNTPTQSNYDAADVAFGYSVGAECTEWLLTLITQIKDEAYRVEESLNLHEVHFHTLKKLLDLTEFFAEERFNALNDAAETYNKEYQDSKGV